MAGDMGHRPPCYDSSCPSEWLESREDKLHGCDAGFKIGLGRPGVATPLNNHVVPLVLATWHELMLHQVRDEREQSFSVAIEAPGLNLRHLISVQPAGPRHR